MLTFEVARTSAERDPGGAPNQAISLTAQCSVPEQVWKGCDPIPSPSSRVLVSFSGEKSSSGTRDVEALDFDSVLGIPRSSECSRGSVALHPTNQRLQTLFVVGIMRHSSRYLTLTSHFRNMVVDIDMLTSA